MVEEKTRTINLRFASERKKGLRAGMPLFHYLATKVDTKNRLKTQKRRLAEEFNVSPRTVGNWLKVLADVGAIKYKYSGSLRLNPNFYHFGTEEEKQKATEEYKLFRSDI